MMIRVRVYKEKHFWLGNVKPIFLLVLLLVTGPVLVLAVQYAVITLSHAAPIPANVVVDAAKSQGTLSRPWEGMSQGGEQESPGKLVSLAPVAGEVRALGTRYIRLDHVLEEPFMETVRARIGEITAAGAVPFISISYFPRAVASSDVGTVSDWGAWQIRVRSLVEMVSGRNGMNISGVYYEVWNEPDGPTFGNFSIGSGKDYYTLYQKTVQAAQSASNVNSFKIGGPALADLRRCTDGALFVCREYWLDRFLKLTATDRTRIDFISWHKYALKMSDYEEDVNFIMNIYDRYSQLPKLEKIITEWGSDPARNKIHNTNFDAAHLVAAARAFIGHVDLATKFEVRDGPDAGDSGWGLLYFASGRKPVYEALRWLSLLRENRALLSGEGSNVTGIASRNSGGVTVIVSNYDRFGSYTETVPVRIINLTPGTYRVTKRVLNALYPFGKQEVTTSTMSTGAFTTSELMLANSIVMYDLQLTGLIGK